MAYRSDSMKGQQLTELFRTSQGAILQDNKRYGYLVEWQGKTTFLKIPWFFSLDQQVEKLCLETFLLGIHDVEIISACGCERVFLLSPAEALEFKELFAGAKAMMKLNSMIHECLTRRLMLI